MALLLRYSDPSAADHPHHARYATVTPGAPGRCPDCDEFGYLDHLDPLARVQTQHCPSCRATWEYRFDPWGHIEEVHGRPSPGRVRSMIDLVGADRERVVDLRGVRAPAR